jgi:ArsR family transcriptional regulator
MSMYDVGMDTCCAAAPIDVALDAEAAPLFKALADPARVHIVEMLGAVPDLCVCDFEEPLGLSQATVSHHLKKLLYAGIVRRERRGTWSHYSIDTERLAHLRHLLDRIGA